MPQKSKKDSDVNGEGFTGFMKSWFTLFMQGSKSWNTSTKLDAIQPQLGIRESMKSNNQAKWNMERAKLKEELRKKGEIPAPKATAVFISTIVLLVILFLIIPLIIAGVASGEAKRVEICNSYSQDDIEEAKRDNCGDDIIQRLEKEQAEYEKKLQEKQEAEEQAAEEEHQKEEAEKQAKSDCSAKNYHWSTTYERCNSDVEEATIDTEEAEDERLEAQCKAKGDGYTYYGSSNTCEAPTPTTPTTPSTPSVSASEMKSAIIAKCTSEYTSSLGYYAASECTDEVGFLTSSEVEKVYNLIKSGTSYSDALNEAL